jgi:hypothetical protein
MERFMSGPDKPTYEEKTLQMPEAGPCAACGAHGKDRHGGVNMQIACLSKEVKRLRAAPQKEIRRLRTLIDRAHESLAWCASFVDLKDESWMKGVAPTLALLDLERKKPT